MNDEMATDTQECAVTAIEKHSGNYEVGHSSLTSPKHANSSTTLRQSPTAQQTQSSPAAVLKLLPSLWGSLISTGIVFACVDKTDDARVAMGKPWCASARSHFLE
jgi:hypothetical protein